MSEADKIKRINEIMAKTLGNQGVPPVTASAGAAGMTANASTNLATGNIAINPNSLAAGSSFPAGLARTLYHEMRHVQQLFHAAQGVANPASVGSSAASNLGAACQQSMKGSGAAMRKQIYQQKKPTNTNTNQRKMAHKQYKALPEEQDAFKIGDSTGDC